MQITAVAARIKAIPLDEFRSKGTQDFLSNLVAELDSTADTMKTAKAKGAQEVSVFANNVLSVADALESGDFAPTMRRDLIERATLFDEKIGDYELAFSEANLAPQRERFSQEVATLETALGNYTVDDPKEGAAVTALEVDLQEVMKRLAQRDQQIQKRLPRQNNTDKFAIIKLPVIVMAGNPLPAKKLEAMGFEVTDFEGYPVIEEQMILAVRNSYARDFNANTGDIADEVVEMLSKAGSVDIVLVSDAGRTVRGSAGFTYYWMMPRPYFDRLMPMVGEFNDWNVAAR